VFFSLFYLKTGSFFCLRIHFVIINFVSEKKGKTLVNPRFRLFYHLFFLLKLLKTQIPEIKAKMDVAVQDPMQLAAVHQHFLKVKK
jgi:hypothetical protein